MSGGLDSSVSAILLQEQGYEIIGITMTIWKETQEEENIHHDIDDAKALAKRLGFEHHVVDMGVAFREQIVQYFVDEYLHGRTPNPCVICNRHIKWDELQKYAQHWGCDYFATGHYVQKGVHDGRYFIRKGKDAGKDQSYMLWKLSQKNLATTLFPLGGMEKSRVREIARAHGFEQLAAKKESYEVCFIPDDDYRGFLNRQVPGLDKKLEGGRFLLADGKEVGKHKGFPYYTIGQRKGLGIALGEPMFVKTICSKENTVVLGKKDELFSCTCQVSGYNLQKWINQDKPIEAIVKIRYQDKGTPATICKEGELLQIRFHQPVSAITPGQSVVFYEGDDLLGGGLIV